jgi:hypothetical protein
MAGERLGQVTTSALMRETEAWAKDSRGRRMEMIRMRRPISSNILISFEMNVSEMRG